MNKTGFSFNRDDFKNRIDNGNLIGPGQYDSGLTSKNERGKSAIITTSRMNTDRFELPHESNKNANPGPGHYAETSLERS